MLVFDVTSQSSFDSECPRVDSRRAHLCERERDVCLSMVYTGLVRRLPWVDAEHRGKRRSVRGSENPGASRCLPDHASVSLATAATTAPRMLMSLAACIRVPSQVGNKCDLDRVIRYALTATQ